jgi:hypothetical protein
MLVLPLLNILILSNGKELPNDVPNIKSVLPLPT